MKSWKCLEMCLVHSITNKYSCYDKHSRTKAETLIIPLNSLFCLKVLPKCTWKINVFCMVMNVDTSSPKSYAYSIWK